VGELKKIGAVVGAIVAGFIALTIVVKQTIERADAFKKMATQAGATIKDIYWTLGSRDVVAICEAPDDKTATVLSLSVASRGNVRSETMRAFSFNEMKKILGKMV
jgi:uncharacterized protein with GYD domain